MFLHVGVAMVTLSSVVTIPRTLHSMAVSYRIGIRGNRLAKSSVVDNGKIAAHGRVFIRTRKEFWLQLMPLHLFWPCILHRHFSTPGTHLSQY
jgi:hypothetical protein